MPASCWIGLHEKITIKTVSFLEYMSLAMGEHIKHVTTKDLLGIMRQIYEHLDGVTQQRCIVYNHISYDSNDLELLFAENDAMTEHVANLKDDFAQYLADEARLVKLAGKIGYKAPDLKEEQKKLEATTKTLKEKLLIGKMGIEVMFCPKCHKTFDLRDDLGTFIPKLVTSLKKIKMNEETGVFLITGKQNE